MAGYRSLFLSNRTVLGQALLSLKATAGFLGRTRRAKLRFEPGFIAAVERHEALMRELERIAPQRELELLAA
jgi:hypothetical protein